MATTWTLECGISGYKIVQKPVKPDYPEECKEEEVACVECIMPVALHCGNSLLLMLRLIQSECGCIVGGIEGNVSVPWIPLEQGPVVRVNIGKLGNIVTVGGSLN